MNNHQDVLAVTCTVIPTIFPYHFYSPLWQLLPLLPAIVFLVVVVLLLITCVVLLVLARAVTTTKLNKLRAEKGHTDPPHYYNQTGRGEESEDGIYDEVRERTGHSHTLKLETLERRQYITMEN